MTKLSKLNINEIERNGKWDDIDPEITGIETNSTMVEKGNIFLAKAGATKNSHGVLFSNQAIERGASLVITDPEGFKFVLDKDPKPTIPFLLVRNLESTFDYLCQIFYPDKPKFIMGVTGTNGKTSVVNFSQQLIEKKKQLMCDYRDFGSWRGFKFKN